MDFYFVKVLMRTRSTGEKGIGYFFGKKNEPPEYRFLVYPRKYDFEGNIDIENDSYYTFLKKFDTIHARSVINYPDVVVPTKDFNNYLHLKISREGGRLFGAKIYKMIADGDKELLAVNFLDMFRDWARDVELRVSASLLSYETLTHLAASSVMLDEALKQALIRPDVKDLPEIYPLVDPTMGVTIDDFDVGDKIHFVILNPGEYKDKLRTLFPHHFDNEGNNIVPMTGILLSKEIVSPKNKEYMLIKVAFGSDMVAKCVISRNVKLMASKERLEAKISTSTNPEEARQLPQITMEQRDVMVEKKYLRIEEVILAILISMAIVAAGVIFAYYIIR